MPMQESTRKSSAERREQIAQTVLRMIGEQGISAFTTTALAREVGVTSGALFRHFDTRDEMLRESVRYATEMIDATFPDNALSPGDRLMAFARNRVHLLQSEPGIVWLLTSEQARLALTGDAVELLEKRVKRSRQFVLDAIREGVTEGSIRDDINPDVLLVLVIGTIHALQGRAGTHKAAATARSRNSDRVLKALMKMIAPNSPVKAATRNKKGEAKK